MKKTSVICFLLLLIVVAAVSCIEDTPQDTSTYTDNTSESTKPEDVTSSQDLESKIVLIADGKANYSIIRPDNCSENLKQAITDFSKKLSEFYGVRIDYETDWTRGGGTVINDKPEILVGKTNRIATQEATAGLDAGTFVIRVINNKVVICGTDDETTINAINLFYSFFVSGDSLMLDKSLDIVNKNPPKFLSSSPEHLYCFEPGNTPLIEATYTSNSAIDLSASTLVVNNNDLTSKAVWTQSSVKLSGVEFAPGNYRAVITLRNTEGGINVLAKEFSVSDGRTMNLYCGEIHSHTSVSDGKGTTEEAYIYARDRGGVDFFAVTDHSYNNVMSSYLNSQIAIADSFNVPGKFVTLYGYELTYFADSGYYGHLNILNIKDFITNSKKLTSVYSQVSVTPGAFIQFNHPGYSWGTFCDFDYYSPAADSAVCLIEVLNPSFTPYYALALAKGWHVSPAYNEDTHDATWTTKSQALTYVLSPALTRANIIESMQKNRTYMTTDKSLKICYKANGQWMGSRLDNPQSLDISVELSTLSADGLGTICLVGEDGIIVASVDAGSKKNYKWEFSLSPEHDYYYIVVTSPSIYAVTAPIWIENRDLITITDIEQGLITGSSDNKDHSVSVSFKNYSKKTITDITVRFYQTGTDGFDITTATPVKTVKLGTLVAGGSATATAEFAYSEVARRVTAVVTGYIDGAAYFDTIYTILSPLYITEILPSPSIYKGCTDPFGYIEIYNNSDSDISLSGYTLRYWTSASADTNGTMYSRVLSGTIKAHGTLVIWFKTIFNTLTVDDFNTYFNTNLVEGENLLIFQGGKNQYYVLSKNQSMQIDITHAGVVVARAQYNWGDNLGEVVADKSVLYNYQRKYTVTAEKVTASAVPTPGVVYESQVPKIIKYTK